MLEGFAAGGFLLAFFLGVVGISAWGIGNGKSLGTRLCLVLAVVFLGVGVCATVIQLATL
jgi:hypothetical protein